MTLSGGDLLVTIDNQIGRIILNRPEKKNSFTVAMLEDWAQALREFQRDERVRVVVVRGTGGAFCAGADLTDIGEIDRTPLTNRRLMTDTVHQVARAVDDLTKPLIAGVSGPAVGAGMDMALMCDYRIASTTARFSEGYIRVGLVPGDGGCFYLPRLIGRSRALRLLWTGEFVTAEQALDWNLVDEVCTDGEFDTRLDAFAAQIAGQPPVAVQMIKSAVRQSDTGDLRSALDLIASHQAVAMTTADSIEALDAYTTRRTPVFEGR
ncbi:MULTISPECIES: enoyl-CoA hydratase/isomerase family protein [unclassified Rhodococcus (in: high G+C Gram-positive bacteria)]|uniref:enoyl-CoA hydratase/isomerase family protein n=1 Tax=unclassified Rhodococcus (in: high G+C Gram-positive bacteria) TaxID=192944 RepID=UPI00163A09BA|nr:MULTISPECIES: enoyl-CoA hydratase-related protein [unclassified Rhodococcus (in: high G+C Gram-positive bacteria)]MBC2637815.1 enoyl-CoA hydratase/isomerase family protein [Rhodococcus sp. 3A]MBC2897439.1 enoyl-CoA hydratase/isomerase family protein [Rhodococcus sp. 4CII]